jgi:hypothetical protein
VLRFDDCNHRRLFLVNSPHNLHKSPKVTCPLFFPSQERHRNHLTPKSRRQKAAQGLIVSYSPCSPSFLVITSFVWITSSEACKVRQRLVMKFIACLLHAIALLTVAIHGYNIQQHSKRSCKTCQHVKQHAGLSRKNFLAIMAGGLTAGAIGTTIESDGVDVGRPMKMMSSAWAKDITSTKGTKEDPAFQACLSQCMYDCTKPKGQEQKTRSECLPECKQKCATNKSQLLRGEPIRGS